MANDFSKVELPIECGRGADVSDKEIKEVSTNGRTYKGKSILNCWTFRDSDGTFNWHIVISHGEDYFGKGRYATRDDAQAAMEKELDEP